MVGCQSAGAVVAAATDLTFSLYGYIAVIINNFLTALYLIMVKNSPATSGLTTTGLLGYNAALSLPLLTAALAVSKEPRQLQLYPGFRWRGFQVWFRHMHASTQAAAFHLLPLLFVRMCVKSYSLYKCNDRNHKLSIG